MADDFYEGDFIGYGGGGDMDGFFHQSERPMSPVNTEYLVNLRHFLTSGSDVKSDGTSDQRDQAGHYQDNHAETEPAPLTTKQVRPPAIDSLPLDIGRGYPITTGSPSGNFSVGTLCEVVSAKHVKGEDALHTLPPSPPTSPESALPNPSSTCEQDKGETHVAMTPFVSGTSGEVGSQGDDGVNKDRKSNDESSTSLRPFDNTSSIEQRDHAGHHHDGHAETDLKPPTTTQARPPAIDSLQLDIGRGYPIMKGTPSGDFSVGTLCEVVSAKHVKGEDVLHALPPSPPTSPESALLNPSSTCEQDKGEMHSATTSFVSGTIGEVGSQGDDGVNKDRKNNDESATSSRPFDNTSSIEQRDQADHHHDGHAEAELKPLTTKRVRPPAIDSLPLDIGRGYPIMKGTPSGVFPAGTLCEVVSTKHVKREDVLRALPPSPPTSPESALPNSSSTCEQDKGEMHSATTSFVSGTIGEVGSQGDDGVNKDKSKYGRKIGDTVMVQCIPTRDWHKSEIIEATEWGVRAVVLDETGESSGHQGWLEHDSRYLRAPFGWWQCAACSKHRMKAEFTNAQLKKKATARCKRCTGSDTTSRRGAIRPHECAECKWIKPKESFTQSQLKKGAAAKCVACADGQGNVTNDREASILNWLEQAYSDTYFDREARWAASYYGEDPVPDENEEEAGGGHETKEAETGARVPL